MLIELLMNLVYLVFSTLTLAIKIPGMPKKVIEIVAILTDYITSGIAIVSNYVDMSYLLILFGIIAVIDTSIFLYRVIMWILRKIPILGIQ